MQRVMLMRESALQMPHFTQTIFNQRQYNLCHDRTSSSEKKRAVGRHTRQRGKENGKDAEEDVG